MGNHALCEKDIVHALELLRSYGFDDQQSVIEILRRVMKTKEALAASDADAETAYRTMREATALMPWFPGDADLFHRLYPSLAMMDSRGILSCLKLSNTGKEMAAPDVLVWKFAEHITGGVQKVLVPECEQYGPGLFDVISAHPDVSFTLTCKQEAKFELLSAVYGPCPNVKMQMTDVCSYGFTPEKFDLIIAVPTLGGRVLVHDEDFISREPDLIAVQNLLYHIRLDGELVIVLPAKITFGGGSTATLRKYIESNYKIKEINALPAGLFAPFTSIRTYLFVFSTGETEDVVLKKYESDRPIRKASPCEKLIVKNELLLFNDEFSDMNGWNVDMAFSEEDDDLRIFNASPVKKLRLRDAAEIFRGKAVNVKSEAGNIRVIHISNITDTGIDYTGLDFMEEEERNVARYILMDGDVLVTARGTTIKVAVFEAQAAACIPSANINVIRPREMLKGAYLKLFLESSVGLKLLKSLQRGSGVVNINYRDMKELEVPVLPMEAQEALVQEYSAGLKFYKDTIAAAEEGWRGVRQDIQSKLF